MSKRERFELAKAKVMRKYKEATTVADSKGKFYVAQDGRDVCN